MVKVIDIFGNDTTHIIELKHRLLKLWEQIEIYSFSKYVPIITNDETDAKQGAIFIPEGETRFDSLRKLIKEIEELVAERDDLLRDKEEKSEEEKEAIKVQVSGLEQEISKKKEGVRRYINQNVELRYLPILNAEQNEVKLYPLKRTLIINGGPGTGKTTTLIQRIKYLTSSDILDNEPDLTLTDEDKSLLFDQNKSWIFFSPTELLKNYLKEAMVKEGLIATDKTAFDWNQFLKKMIREYLLVNTETKRPFIFHKSDKSYFKNDRTATSTLLTAFDTVYFNYNIEKLEKINKIDIKGKAWEKLADEIIKYIKSTPDKSDNKSLIRLYFNLNEKFNGKSKEINQEYKQLMDTEIASIIHKIKAEPELLSWFEEELKKAKQSKQQQDEEEDEEDELEEENFEETAEVVQQFNLDLELSRKLKIILRKASLRKFDENTKLTKKDRPYFEKINEKINEDARIKIGERALFKKYFERLTNGVETNLLKEIATIYKKFRKQKIKETGILSKEGIETLDEILKSKNMHLHKEEQSFLLYKINVIIKDIHSAYTPLYKSSGNPYIVAYRESAKAVVAIDEATDFSSLDLSCMGSFSHPRFNSVTLCGDIMQRLEESGISSWDDYMELDKKTEIKNLLVSFRQTPLLFELAKKIYLQTTGTEPGFTSYQESGEYDPKPLLFINPDKEQTAEWISDRIIEIHHQYNGVTPSIAIFVADEEDISPLTKLINNYESLGDLGIEAVECPQGRVLGNANNIRIYSVKYIKGLEFEAVFFADTDKLNKNHQELVDKYLYVGLSRATYFLAITAIDNLPDRLEILRTDLIENGNWNIF
jgi:hypothetical protein